MGHYSSFILRFWVEPDQGWRWGLIEHVATRERVRFSSAEEMLEFIQSHSEVNELSLPFILESDEPPTTPSDDDVPVVPISRRSKKRESKLPKVIDGS